MSSKQRYLNDLECDRCDTTITVNLDAPVPGWLRVVTCEHAGDTRPSLVKYTAQAKKEQEKGSNLPRKERDPLRDKENAVYADVRIDLCPECAEAFETFMKEGP